MDKAGSNKWATRVTTKRKRFSHTLAYVAHEITRPMPPWMAGDGSASSMGSEGRIVAEQAMGTGSLYRVSLGSSSEPFEVAAANVSAEA